MTEAELSFPARLVAAVPPPQGTLDKAMVLRLSAALGHTSELAAREASAEERLAAAAELVTAGLKAALSGADSEAITALVERVWDNDYLRALSRAHQMVGWLAGSVFLVNEGVPPVPDTLRSYLERTGAAVVAVALSSQSGELSVPAEDLLREVERLATPSLRP